MIDRMVETFRNELKFVAPPLELLHLEVAIPKIKISELPHSPIGCELSYVDPGKRIAQINIRKRDVSANKLLAVCHALGHYFLHPGKDFACRLDFFGELCREEAEATYFAETLIMPHRLVTRMYKEMANDYDPVYKLAKCFAVKRQIMEERLNALNLL